MKPPFKSIRWRLQAWHGLILLLVAFGFCEPAYRLAENNQLQRIDKELARAERTLIRALMEALRSPEANASPADRKPLSFSEFVQKLKTMTVTLPADVETLFQGTEPGHAYFSIRGPDDRVLLQSANAPADLELLPVPKDEMVEESRTVGHRREFGRSSSHGFRILVGRDITPEKEEMRRLAVSLRLTVLGVWLLGLLGGWWLAGRAIRPIKHIGHIASRIAEGNLEERIDITDTDNELGELSHVLNQTFERLHASFERQKQFTADASHELRTPITILLSETQRTLKRERTPEEYKEVIRTCSDTARRMSQLVDSLLILARQDAGKRERRLDPCDLADLAAEAGRGLAPLAAEKNIAVETSLKPAPCTGDPSALTILITNLVANAIQHHQADGHVWLESGVEQGRSFLRVRDDGPGIPAEDLPHLFERFYRVDKARTRGAGHSGLGLAIAKAIADNHGAEIGVQSEEGRGSVFEVKLGEREA